MKTTIINYLAWEQSGNQIARFNYFTNYANFMSFFIKEPRDAFLLCIDVFKDYSREYSQDNKLIVNLFNDPAKNSLFDSTNCYLSNQFRSIEEYCGRVSVTLTQKYFKIPWLVMYFISVALILLFTSLQTTIAVVTFTKQFPKNSYKEIAFTAALPFLLFFGLYVLSSSLHCWLG
ncbi:hypothetical protein L1049_023184 [Liquidambar formosana]|uniref:Uncharacterized protein n=1 Tax=Liquidambar formosana TaxID=63359 RepID=A0AAP0RDS9_LIQFO